jgi:hypothetical protein
MANHAALTGILFVLKSGMTCWRRLKQWHEAGLWQRLHRALLDIAPIRRPRRRLRKLHADKGYDFPRRPGSAGEHRRLLDDVRLEIAYAPSTDPSVRRSPSFNARPLSTNCDLLSNHAFFRHAARRIALQRERPATGVHRLRTTTTASLTRPAAS